MHILFFFRYIYQPDNTINSKSLYVAIQCQKYYLHHVSKPDNFQERKYYNLCKTFGLVCEGANFILMRYIAITRYSGTFELSTMYINGDMCRNIYVSTGYVVMIQIIPPFYKFVLGMHWTPNRIYQ